MNGPMGAPEGTGTSERIAAARERAATRPERAELMRLLLLARGLERVLAALRGRPQGPGAREADSVLTAIAAASALAGGDRLVAPHALLAAHMAGGATPAEVAAARLGEPGGPGASRIGPVGIGPQSPLGIAAGVAYAARGEGAPGVVAALTDARWLTEEPAAAALALADRLELPLVVIAIGGGAAGSAAVVDRHDFEAVRGATWAALEAARGGERPEPVVCAAPLRDERRTTDQVARFRTRIEDPITAYERWLMINGFPRSELDGMRGAATRELDAALGTRLAAAVGSRGVSVARGAA